MARPAKATLVNLSKKSKKGPGRPAKKKKREPFALEKRVVGPVSREELAFIRGVLTRTPPPSNADIAVMIGRSKAAVGAWRRAGLVTSDSQASTGRRGQDRVPSHASASNSALESSRRRSVCCSETVRNGCRRRVAMDSAPGPLQDMQSEAASVVPQSQRLHQDCCAPAMVRQRGSQAGSWSDTVLG